MRVKEKSRLNQKKNSLSPLFGQHSFISFFFIVWRRIIPIGIFFLALSITGCAVQKETVKRSNSSQRTQIVQSAQSRIGSVYRYGSKGPKSFDCSGLVNYAYGRSGIKVNGSAQTLSDLAKAISLTKVRPGDLVFYKKGKKVFHVSIVSQIKRDGIWVVHSTTSRGVIEENLSDSSYWKDKIYKVLSLDDITK